MRSGVTARSYLNTISDNCTTTGRSFSLKYSKWLEATNVFKANIEIDYDEAFTCIRCQGEPSYITCDGKSLAPLKRKLIPLKLTELSSHPEDKEILAQGSHHQMRVYLSSSGERKIFTKLLVGDKSISEFLSNTSDITSDNGKLLLNDIRRFQDHESLPQPYNKLFTEVCRNVAVAGFIQVNSSKAINLLRGCS